MNDQQKREILRPLMNVPHVLSLKFATPREVEGRYGNQMMFTVEHEGTEKLIFLDPVTAKRITDQGIGADESFVLTRRKLTQGRKKGIQWVIAREGAAEEPRRQGSSPAAAVAANPPHRRIADSRSNGSQSSTPAPEVAAAPKRPQVVPMPAPEGSPAPSPLSVAGQVMGGCLIAAIDALTIAKAYALRQGLKLEWNEEDVRATGASLFIQHHRDAGFAARPAQTSAAGGAR